MCTFFPLSWFRLHAPVESLQSESHSRDRTGDANLEPCRSIVIIIRILSLRTLTGGIVPAAGHLVRHIDALCTANLLGKLDSAILALLIAVLVETARDAVDEIGVGADASDVELSTVGYLVAGGVVFEAGFLLLRLARDQGGLRGDRERTAHSGTSSS